MQTLENATKLCNLDTLSIVLSKLQGPQLKLACFLESKEVNVGKQLSWHSLKKHLTNNYSEIPYDTHAINAYNDLHQDSDESTSVYLHRAQDILEHIHHTTDMATISAIGTNHMKILTGLKDGRLCKNLAESKAKKWINMSQVLQDVADMAINFERSHGYLLPTFEVQYISSHTSSSSFRPHRQSMKNTQNTAHLEKPKCWHCQGDHYKKDCSTVPKQSSPTKQLTTKDKQCNLIKNFHKKFQVHWQINKVYTSASDDTEDVNNFISEFKNIMLEVSDDSSAWLISSSVLSVINKVFIDGFHALYNIHISNVYTSLIWHWCIN